MNPGVFFQRMAFVVYGENRWRMTIRILVRGSPEITYDAHGQSVAEAKRTIHNIVNIAMVPIHLTVIHGFNHGCAIKNMLAAENFDNLKERYCPEYNPGETVLFISAA